MSKHRHKPSGSTWISRWYALERRYANLPSEPVFVTPGSPFPCRHGAYTSCPDCDRESGGWTTRTAPDNLIFGPDFRSELFDLRKRAAAQGLKFNGG